MGNLFFSIRGFAAHREKSNSYSSSDEDFLISLRNCDFKKGVWHQEATSDTVLLVP